MVKVEFKSLYWAKKFTPYPARIKRQAFKGYLLGRVREDGTDLIKIRLHDGQTLYIPAVVIKELT